jgi:hypothetical protein
VSIWLLFYAHDLQVGQRKLRITGACQRRLNPPHVSLTAALGSSHKIELAGLTLYKMNESDGHADQDALKNPRSPPPGSAASPRHKTRLAKRSPPASH